MQAYRLLPTAHRRVDHMDTGIPMSKHPMICFILYMPRSHENARTVTQVEYVIEIKYRAIP